jgi:hypothetical protein
MPTSTQRSSAGGAPRRRRPAAWLGWALWALAMLGLAWSAWLDHLLRRAGHPELTSLSGSGVPPVLGVVSAGTVGAVLAGRRPRHSVGWLLLGLALAVTASAVGDGYQRYGLIVRPGSLPAAHYVAVLNPATLAIMLSCVGFVLLLTPTGSLPSPRWRWWARVAAAAPVVFVLAVAVGPEPLDSTNPVIHAVRNPMAVPALAGVVDPAGQLSLAVVIAALLAATWSLVLRFRRARGAERLQLRWMALAGAVLGLAALVIPAALATQTFDLFEWAFGVCVAVLPLAVGAAILRYRLYDLDRIVSRTVAYGLLTVLLGGAYAAVVLGLGQLAGRQSSLLVAGATLAVAAAFQPARRRIQELVDRRFNRRRYDAAATIEEFSVRLRQQVDLDSLRSELLSVVDQTMQPTGVSLWLRPSSGDPGSVQYGPSVWSWSGRMGAWPSP